MPTMKCVCAVAFVLACAASGHAQDEVVYAQGNGVSTPKVVRDVKPQYTSEAMHEKIQGVVILEGVVKSDGTVGTVTVKQSLDRFYGLDDSCVRALKQWKFTPGMKDGKAVAVRITVTMTFAMN
jgi:periplasmic protein TonB